MISLACGRAGVCEKLCELRAGGAAYPYAHVVNDPFGGATPLRLVPSPLRDVSCIENI